MIVQVFPLSIHPIIVHTIDSPLLSFVGHETLLSSSFHVASVSYVLNLMVQLISGQHDDYGCVLFLNHV
jgi:hypothetical protein